MTVRNTLLATLTMFVATFLLARTAGSEDIECVMVEAQSGEKIAEYSIGNFKNDFPIQDLITQTPWTKAGERIHYRGVFLKDVLAKHGFDMLEKVEVFADDGFLSEIALDEIDRYSPIIAFERECLDRDYGAGHCAPGAEFRPLTIEDQGPFFLVWPYDELPEQFVPTRNHLWVWWVIGVRPLP